MRTMVIIKNKVNIAFLLGIYACLFMSSHIVFAAAPYALDQKNQNTRRGIWVTAFSDKKVFYSKEAVIELIKTCNKAKINEIYLQLYRGGQAYYQSVATDRTKYDEIRRIAGVDTIDLLIKEANKSNIKVFGWINVLSLAQNKKAHIISKFGSEILTRDQYLRPSIRDENANASDKYYLRDDQLFLEPGDLRVTEYTLSIVAEIIERYPLISGIHLDYIRYPLVLPSIPGSRFNKYGLTYGYGEKNFERFKQKTGLSPLNITYSQALYLDWDNWKRDQVTGLVEKISKLVKEKSPNMMVSCAVMPAPERAYAACFQDWPLWLEKGIVDYVVAMNYTIDNRLALENARSALAHRGKGKVLVGIGLFLMKDDTGDFLEQYKLINGLNPDGIVIFSYDDINEKIFRHFIHSS